MNSDSREKQDSNPLIQKFRQQYPGYEVVWESVEIQNGVTFFMSGYHQNFFLILLSENEESITSHFSGERLNPDGLQVLKCEKNHHNAEELRKLFPFTKPVLIGKENSYGLGDRLGNAGVAHLKAVRKTSFKPVLAQQSIRELTRTNRTAGEVLDAASWAAFQTGYREGFGADGDHLKTSDDIDLMVKAGYTMFTIDPSDHVVNEALTMSNDELKRRFSELPWKELKDEPDAILGRYDGKTVELTNAMIGPVSREDLMISMVKYGRVIAHTKIMSDYLQKSYPDHPAELELSVDETDEPTTLFEHYLIASELSRLGVELVSLAPRFCGDFEKGIDFKGDLDQFKSEYSDHLAIAEKFGGYKLSIHSGSDKFSVYEAVGSLNRGAVHVKTAGTSYLEALRTVAEAEPAFFREILEYCRKRFDEDKKTYHISGKLENIPPDQSLRDHQLKELLDDNDARQVLHVTYGSVLAGKDTEAASFKEQLMECLEKNSELYEKNLEIHFDKHLEPFC